MNTEPKFILWSPDPSYGVLTPRRDDAGRITSDGAIGRVGPRNAAFTMWAATWPDATRPEALAVGESIDNVWFSASGTSSCYDVYRVS